MKVFLRSRLILILVALVLIASAMAIPLALSGSHSRAAAPQSKGPTALAAMAARLPFTFRPPQSSHTVTVGHPSISINLRDDGRLLYVDAGSCPGPGNSGDSIDVYRIFSTGLVHVGNFPTGGCSSFNSFTGGGTQDLDVTPANGNHGPCLVYADASNGFVSSFPILSTGALGAQVSHLAASAFPIDVHITQNGKLVYVDGLTTLGPPSVLSSYSVGAGCVLTALTSLATTSHLYVSLALINATRLASVDIIGGTIDTYALTVSGGITLLNSVPGQLSSNGPSVSIAVAPFRARKGQQDVFTGQFTITPGAPQVQGGQETVATGAITFLTGSPASDPSGLNGEVVFADNDHLLLVQGENGSNSLGVYKITPGHSGSMAFLQHTLLATPGGGVPVGFARMDNTLFVAAGLHGDVEACLINSSGVSGCATAAVLTNPTGFEGGIVLL